MSTGVEAVDELERTVREFSVEPLASKRTMQGLLAHRPRDFLAGAVRLLKEPFDALAHRYLVSLLLANDLCVRALCDPHLLSSDAALELARAASPLEPLLDTKLLRRLVDEAEGQIEETGGAAAERVLQIIAEISDGSRVAPVLAQLLRHPNARVQSKAAALLGRWNRNPRWTEQRLREADPRVRANAVEALWGVDSEAARAVLAKAAADPDNRVVGNALVGLYRLGDPGAAPALLRLAEHEHDRFRTTAAWAMGETQDPCFLPALKVLATKSGGIQRNALRALAKIKASAGA